MDLFRTDTKFPGGKEGGRGGWREKLLSGKLSIRLKISRRIDDAARLLPDLVALW